MMAANHVGDVKESSMHQPLLLPEQPWQRWCHSVSRLSSQCRTALHLVNGTMISPYYLNNIINPVIVSLHEQHGPNIIFMEDNTPAHPGRIIREQLLETVVNGKEWPERSPD
ncbi:hypothetical protein ILYODFUR_024271 [Ilyodon furcidens]|uniref:Tc1-like transposase DDE domain-containing protein n=1 Tax=Ilyodon furcidens TaxID=33524 RepID=A0ABV0SP90_9TELE